VLHLTKCDREKSSSGMKPRSLLNSAEACPSPTFSQSETARLPGLSPMTTSRLSVSVFVAALLGLIAILAGCRSTPANAVTWTLTGTVWKVAEIGGAMVGSGTIPTLQMETDGTRVTGTGGINRYNCTYRTEGAALSFGPAVTTRMAGAPAQMETEMRFLQMLEKVTAYRIDGPWLILLSGEETVARAQATPATTFGAP
jgi:heat shock protein HslJ